MCVAYVILQGVRRQATLSLQAINHVFQNIQWLSGSEAQVRYLFFWIHNPVWPCHQGFCSNASQISCFTIRPILNVYKRCWKQSGMHLNTGKWSSL